MQYINPRSSKKIKKLQIREEKRRGTPNDQPNYSLGSAHFLKGSVNQQTTSNDIVKGSACLLACQAPLWGEQSVLENQNLEYHWLKISAVSKKEFFWNLSRGRMSETL